MWSEALLQMDENTLKYQVERMQAENEKLREQREADKAHRDIICPCKKRHKKTNPSFSNGFVLS